MVGDSITLVMFGPAFTTTININPSFQTELESMSTPIIVPHLADLFVMYTVKHLL